MRKSLSLVLFLGLAGATLVQPSRAQITSGNENVQDAIRFERQKQAAADRQARLDARRSESSSADRSATETKANPKARRARKGSAARSTTGEEKANK